MAFDFLITFYVEETYLFVVQHEDLMQSTYCPVIPEEGTFFVNALKLETLSTQISASKFQNLSQISLKICGDWKNRGV